MAFPTPTCGNSRSCSALTEFIKAALAATDLKAITQPIVGPSDFRALDFGQWVTIVSFSYGKYRVNGTINEKNLIELTGSWICEPGLRRHDL